MNAINYKKLEAIGAQRPLKVSDIFLAAADPFDWVDWEEFFSAGISDKAIDDARAGGYIVGDLIDCDDYTGNVYPIYCLSKKGRALITKHMK